MLSYLISIALINSESEHAIISILIKLAKFACQFDDNLIHDIFYQLSYLSIQYKDEYDRVALTNA